MARVSCRARWSSAVHEVPAVAVNDDAAELLGLIACPVCRASLASADGGLTCTGCGRHYELVEGVPALALDDASAEPSALGRLHYALLGSPKVYEFHQKHCGARHIADRVEVAVRDATGLVLDIGAGTGMVAPLLPGGARYVWLDNDRLKLRGLLARGVDCIAVLADGARLPLPDGSVDWTVMVEVSHHLPEEALRACLAEAARVTRDRFVFVDGLRGDRLRSNLMWKVDLGRFPRSEPQLLALLGESFDVERVERFRVNHDHLLCVCRRRAGG